MNYSTHKFVFFMQENAGPSATKSEGPAASDSKKLTPAPEAAGDKKKNGLVVAIK